MVSVILDNIAAGETTEAIVHGRGYPAPLRNHRLGEAGVLGEDDRVELIDGDIVEMSPIGSSHAGLVIRLTRWFVEHAADRGVVSVQNPLRIGDRCVPQPDLLLLKPRPDDYGDDHPRPADVLLLVEGCR